MRTACVRAVGRAAALPVPGEHGLAALGQAGTARPVLAPVWQRGAEAGSSHACLAAEPAAGHPPGG